MISLQMTDLAKRGAEVSLILGKHKDKYLPTFAALEAIARITADRFDEHRLFRITAGQSAQLLVKWNKNLEVDSCRKEWAMCNSIQRGHVWASVYRTAARYDNFLALKECRNGCFWARKRRNIATFKAQARSFVCRKSTPSYARLRRSVFWPFAIAQVIVG